MKSLRKHIESTNVAIKSAMVRKPIFRSSAIFPVIHNTSLSSKILFLGYWLIKHNIKEVTVLVTLRDQKGDLMVRESLLVDCVKAYSVELDQLLAKATLDDTVPDVFTGSIELEIFSTRDLVFPYPAFVVSYYNENFSTVVHTTGRIFNDIEDLQSNTGRRVAETGFDIYDGEGMRPFVSFVNGPIANEKPVVTYKINNDRGELSTGEFEMEPIAPYETVFLYLDEYIDLGEHLKGGMGAIKMTHNFTGFFPRFIAGNYQQNPDTISITHTYYDCSPCELPEDYWERQSTDFHDCAILAPLFLDGDNYTDLAIYPLFSPSSFSIHLEFFDGAGNLLGRLDEVTQLDNRTKEEVYQLVKIKQLIQDKPWMKEAHSVKIIGDCKGGVIPSRIKLGLNVGVEGKEAKLPCNICFSVGPGNPALEKKPGTFKWSPIVNLGTSVLVFENSSNKKVYTRSANIDVKVFRENDQKFIERTYTLPPFGDLRINIKDDDELRTFLGESSGWVTAKADNPYVIGWYFDFHESGAVGGDHSF